MIGRRKLLAATAALGLFSTGCFQLSGFKFTKQAVAKGEKTVLELKLTPNTFEGNKDHPFVILILPPDQTTEEYSTKAVVTQPKVFDVHEQFGAQRSLVPDTALQNVAMTADSVCESYVHAEGYKAILLRTATPLNDRGRITKTALTRIGLKYTSTEDPFTGRFVSVQAIVGAWDDTSQGTDNDGIPQEGEVLCNSDADTNFVVKPDGTASPTTVKQRIREYRARS